MGDNIFYGHGPTRQINIARSHVRGAAVFGYWVKHPQRYRVVSFDDADRVETLARPLMKNGYGRYLMTMLESDSSQR